MKMTEMASNGTPLDVLTMDDWETPYRSGSKFTTVAAEKVYSWTLGSGQDEECGNATDWHLWSARFDPKGTEDMPGGPMGGGVILTVDSQEFVNAERFGTRSGCAETWASLVREWDEHLHSDCEDGADCGGCVNCDNI
jgi:hypothetical protein